MNDLRPWHRLFGLSWKDFFQDTPVTVETEVDLSQKLQLLDVLLIRKGAAALPRRLPDGFENHLRPFNLVSFKSYQETLDGWTLNEHVGHYVNVRKQVSPSMQNLLPESDFALFAVSVRYPRDLAKQVPLTEVGQGVYEARHFSGTLRIVVVHQLPQEEHNSLFHLFSAKPDVVKYGAEHYQPRSREWTTLLIDFFAQYQQEGIPMPYTLEEYEKETLPGLLAKIPVEIRLKGLSAEELIQGLPAETLAALVERLKAKESASKQE